ncbi:hypothetical protein ACFL2A_02820 [Thermodesulfobacteriota bacterium]
MAEMLAEREYKLAEADMTYFNTVSLIVSFLGGGIVSAGINWIRANRTDIKDREIRFLDDQIRKLYGPLYYLILQSENLIQLNNRYNKAYNNIYCNNEWSQDEHTQRKLHEDTSATIATANEYIEMVGDNNEKIKEVLDNHYPLLDPDDIQTTMVFFEDHTRLNVEQDDNGKLTIPIPIYTSLGDISYLRPEVIERIKTKFLDKKERLKSLML